MFHNIVFKLICTCASRELTDREARHLVAALNSEDGPLVSELLAAAANYAAFRSNHDRFIQAGLIALLPKLLLSTTTSSSIRAVRQKACCVAANMALNEENHSG